ncbi:MAG: gamma-glutamyltransferase, partial [Chloroflexota bacterium]|nr:gamma-glutamyltransferase [Chloroflexota bacterium]
MSLRATEIQYAQPMLGTMGGMVTANHRSAAESGAGMLARGGNAVDAAVATAIAVGVVEPAMSGIAGRGYMMIHFSEDGSNAIIDGHERAPLAARADMYDVQATEQIPTHGWGPQYRVADDAHMLGHRSVAVPGVLAALCLAHQRYGKLPLATVVEPAIALAEEGFAVSVPLAVMIAQFREKLARFPATSAIFLNDGHALRPGDWLRQPDLAKSFRLVAEHGPAAFYEGPLADAIAAEMERGGGIITKQDLSEFEPRVWDQPLVGTYRGYRLLTMPEATGGVTLIQIMNMLEGYDLAAYEPFDPRYLHLQLEAGRIAFRDRMAYVEDPAFAEVP